ncbi:MAG: pyridoxal-phosphate dependent enzyme, partial [Acinetobacter sp.]
PYRLQGQKTIAYEIVEALGRAPDYHCLPVGNAGNITAHWMGYTEAVANQPADQFEQVIYDAATDQFTGPKPEGLPIMVGYQADGAAPFLRGAPVENPETVATAIRIGNPQSWNHAKAVVRDSKGWFDELADAEILEAQRLLSMYEGVFVEPASAASIGGAIRDIKAGKIAEGSVIVCTVTGNGLKDPDTAIKQCADAVMLSIDATMAQVKDSILSNM